MKNFSQAKKEKIAVLYSQLLGVLGTSSYDQPGLKDTPERVAKFWEEFMCYDDNNINTTFETVQVDQMIVVSGIQGWSLCEHHLLPFSFTVHVCYITGKKVIGLSKIPRIVKKCARKLQIQERLTNDIADALEEVLEDAKGVGVIVTDSVHTCTVMRGIESQGTSMTTSCMRGVLLANPVARQEFLSLIP